MGCRDTIGKRLKHIATLLLPTVMAAAISCGRTGSDNRRTESEQAQFISFNDSMLKRGNAAPAFCDSMMAAATDSFTYYDYKILKGRYYLLSDHPDSALALARATLAFAQRHEPSPRTLGLEAMANSTEAGLYHLMRRNTQQSISLYTKAYGQVMASDLIYYSPEIAANLADAYIAADDLPNGAKWYRRALLLVDSLELPEDKNITLYMGLGQIYTMMEDYRTAGLYYGMTDKKAGLMKPNMQSYFLNNYGNYHYYKGDYGNALATFERLRKLLCRIGAQNSYDMHLCYINMADTYLNLGMADSAEAYVDKAQGYFARHNVQAGTYYANTIRIGIALTRRDYAAIERILDGEGKLAPYVQSIKNIRNKYLQEYYTQTGNYKQAYNCLKENMAQNDSLEHNRKHMRADEIMMRFTEDTLKLHHQIELNEKNVEVNRSRAAISLFLTIIIAMALLMVCATIVMRKRKIQNRMEMLTLKLYETRQRISPHFVFNVLNTRIGAATDGDADSLLRLSRLLRNSLEMTAKAYVTLKEEMDFIHDYTSLERLLIGENFDVDVSAPPPEKLQGILIPAMFVQILVENAIKHGLKNTQGPKRLGIAIDCTDAATTITVTDNGPGFNITRAGNSKGKNGLNIITHTIAIINQENKGAANKMSFHIGNIETPDGRTAGCKATLTIPRAIKFI